VTEKSEEQTKNTLSEELQQRATRLDWCGFAAGASFILSLLAGGAYITSTAGTTTPTIISNYSALLVSYFIGSSAGHYYGKAISEGGSSVHSAYLGAFSVLVLYWLYRVQVSPLSAALVFMTLSLILAHGTDIIQRSKEIKRGVDYFAKGLSPFGILVFGVFEFIPSGVINVSAVVHTVHNSLTETVNFQGASVNIVVFAIGALVVLTIGLVVLATMFRSDTSQGTTR
jgi:uncharacterized protein YhhL (DUF1145 family)